MDTCNDLRWIPIWSILFIAYKPNLERHFVNWNSKYSEQLMKINDRKWFFIVNNEIIKSSVMRYVGCIVGHWKKRKRRKWNWMIKEYNYDK